MLDVYIGLFMTFKLDCFLIEYKLFAKFLLLIEVSSELYLFLLLVTMQLCGLFDKLLFE